MENITSCEQHRIQKLHYNHSKDKIRAEGHVSVVQSYQTPSSSHIHSTPILESRTPLSTNIYGNRRLQVHAGTLRTTNRENCIRKTARMIFTAVLMPPLNQPGSPIVSQYQSQRSRKRAPNAWICWRKRVVSVYTSRVTVTRWRGQKHGKGGLRARSIPIYP